jgi:hypothetical protein
MSDMKNTPTCSRDLKKHALPFGLASALAFTPAAVSAAIINVSTVSQLRSALANAASGDEIVIAAGTYKPSTVTTPQLYTTDGVIKTAAMFQISNKSNVTIRGASSTNKPILKSLSPGDGNYIFYAHATSKSIPERKE